MKDAVRQLSDLLREAGARVTFDRRRTFNDPCWLCATTSEPRELVAIGTYTRPMGGNLQPGDRIERPLCARCREMTEPVTPAEGAQP